MTLKEILHKHGFYLIEENTQIYSHKTLRPIVSIRRLNTKSKTQQFLISTDKEWENGEEVIVPYLNVSDQDKHIIRTEEGLLKYYSINNNHKIVRNTITKKEVFKGSQSECINYIKNNNQYGLSYSLLTME